MGRLLMSDGMKKSPSVAQAILGKLTASNFWDVVEEMSVAAYDWFYNENDNCIITYIFEDNSELTINELTEKVL